MRWKTGLHLVVGGSRHAGSRVQTSVVCDGNGRQLSWDAGLRVKVCGSELGSGFGQEGPCPEKGKARTGQGAADSSNCHTTNPSSRCSPSLNQPACQSICE